MAGDDQKDAGNAAGRMGATMMGGATRAGEAMRDAGQRMAESGQSLSMRMLDHAEENVRQAFQAMRAAASAKDPGEVMRIQGDYLKEQGSRGMTQAREIGEMIVKMGQAGAGTQRAE